MTAVLSIAGLMALFVTFGLVHRNGRSASGCGSCTHDAGGEQCASCSLP